MVEVDPAFFQAVEHRPKPTVIEAKGIPVIDLSSLNSLNPSEKSALVEKVGEACRHCGFFQVINHGIPAEIRRKLEVAAKEFFDLSIDEKGKIRRDEANPLGYYDIEHTKNVRDWKEVFDFAVIDPTFVSACSDPKDKRLKKMVNRWPLHPPELREACEEYARETEKLSFKLLELISLSLGLPEDRLNGFFKDQMSFIRLNHYPPCPVPHLALGVGRHKDAGALTVLSQDSVGGLEVKRKSDGEWVRVKPVPDAYIINVGDIIQVWSNDRYESVEHRVMVNPEKERFSIPFFFNPAHYTIVEPLEELSREQNVPANYKPYSWGKFFAARKDSNYKKLNVENIQIYHFKLASDQ